MYVRKHTNSFPIFANAISGKIFNNPLSRGWGNRKYISANPTESCRLANGCRMEPSHKFFLNFTLFITSSLKNKYEGNKIYIICYCIDHGVILMICVQWKKVENFLLVRISFCIWHHLELLLAKGRSTWFSVRNTSGNLHYLRWLNLWERKSLVKCNSKFLMSRRNSSAIITKDTICQSK